LKRLAQDLNDNKVITAYGKKGWFMKAAVYYDTNDIRIEERDMPVPGKGEALIKMHACGLCGTDIHKAIHKTVKPGTVLGHEVSGEIVRLGEGVEGFRVGDRVFVAHHVPCLLAIIV